MKKRNRGSSGGKARKVVKVEQEREGTLNSIGLICGESGGFVEKRLQATPAAEAWQKIGIEHHFGVNVPVFSLKTKESCGIGEYCDLMPLIDWCCQEGFDIIQTLPLNSTNHDNSPFSPTSTYSLNPLLLSITALAKRYGQTIEMEQRVKEMQGLNKENCVQWEKVRTKKAEWMKLFFERHFNNIKKSSEYRHFVEDNDFWLDGFVVFCILKEKFEWKSWEEWPEKYQNPTPEMISDFSEDHESEVNLHKLIQFLCHRQLKMIKAYANDKNVFLKGDIPYLVSRDSADVWLNRHLFDMTKSAGAPPDMYSADGQNWGLPLYNWEEMEREDYAWWKNRLRVAEQYFNIYRIDHIVGFFRIWAIPVDKKATEGKYEPEDNSLWIPNGEKHLKMMLESCGMLPIGEDLGTIPPEVRRSLQRLGICGTKVLRWEREWEQEGQPFIPVEQYNADSMSTVSTHDSETLSLWWVNKDEQESIKEYCKMKKWDYEEGKKMSKDQRLEILKDSHKSASLFHINLLQEYLALEPSLVHENPELERINIPAKVLPSNWSYRLPKEIWDIERNSELSDQISSLPTKNSK